MSSEVLLLKKKPVPVEGIQWQCTQESENNIRKFLGDDFVEVARDSGNLLVVKFMGDPWPFDGNDLEIALLVDDIQMAVEDFYDSSEMGDLLLFFKSYIRSEKSVLFFVDDFCPFKMIDFLYGEEIDFVNEVNPVICQDCLKVVDYTEQRHAVEELCECGGEFCGCGGCQTGARKLLLGNRNAQDIGLQEGFEILDWSPEKGGVFSYKETAVGA